MYLLDMDIEYRVIIGISAMILLFGSFLVSFISSQRKKLQYHKDLEALHEEQRQTLTNQNTLLEKKVEERTAELKEQKEALQHSLSELKLTQNQLVQREKMASLGELTAGIAHEIQNPLNFVNNFSEINTELLAEMKGHLSKETLSKDDNTQINNLVSNVSDNFEKIVQHGKRADAIVKSMLQHSRMNPGDNELTDVNQLCSEYIKLSYQGFRARNKLFNTQIETDFDQNLDKININAQSIARVVLNLLNNAFYSMDEKKKKLGETFKPVVVVRTIRESDHFIIRIRDNGVGIPEKIIDKIFNPFFTTKPSGQGTGLGLSLSYDIIKALGGELKVSSSEGEFAEFNMIVPIAHQ
ncbi:MAG TPA: ATP-binding protein [Puia sp.]|nr:ATP-binding protein [Puia sp.]